MTYSDKYKRYEEPTVLNRHESETNPNYTEPVKPTHKQKPVSQETEKHNDTVQKMVNIGRFMRTEEYQKAIKYGLLDDPNKLPKKVQNLDAIGAYMLTLEVIKKNSDII